MNVLHVISSLNQGGAEGVLYRLIKATRERNRHCVASLRDEGYYGPLFRELGIEVLALGMPKGQVTMQGLMGIRRAIYANRPAVVQTWMYHADLVGGLIARSTGANNVVWGIRNSNLDAGTVSVATRTIARTCAWLSRWIPRSIISCSEEARATHEALGYAKNKIEVIPNGYDINALVPDVMTRVTTRRELAISDSAPVIGMLARWHPHKDHANLIVAMGYVWSARPDAYLVCAGMDVDESNKDIVRLIRQVDGRGRIRLLGARGDVCALMNAIDIHVLSSSGEAFPNVVAEAMACGTPCVSTDVGDAALIIGETGWIVPPRSPRALAKGVLNALASASGPDWAERRQRCRERIVKQFSLENMARAYETTWKSCATGLQ